MSDAVRFCGRLSQSTASQVQARRTYKMRDRQGDTLRNDGERHVARLSLRYGRGVGEQRLAGSEQLLGLGRCLACAAERDPFGVRGRREFLGR
mgnify:CR=1 FL=1